MLPTNFQVNCLLSLGEEGKKKIFKMATAIFDLQVTLMLPTKFEVNWPFGSG